MIYWGLTPLREDTKIQFVSITNPGYLLGRGRRMDEGKKYPQKGI